MWATSLLGVGNVLGHNVQGLSLAMADCPLWVRRCVLRLPAWLNDFPHSWQSWGFCPVCISMCLASVLGAVNVLGHNVQGLSLAMADCCTPSLGHYWKWQNHESTMKTLLSVGTLLLSQIIFFFLYFGKFDICTDQQACKMRGLQRGYSRFHFYLAAMTEFPGFSPPR